MTTDTLYETEEVGPYTVEIHQDEDGWSNNPRDWDNGTIMVLAHDRYDLPNEASIDFEDFGSWSEVHQYIVQEFSPVAIASVYMIDHSGISFRCGRDFGDCDPGAWDSGQVGFIFATQETIDTVGTPPEHFQALLEGDVKDYDDYSCGNVWGYVVKDAEGETLDSCWGFLGDTDDAMSEGKAMAQWYVDEDIRKANLPWPEVLFENWLGEPA